MVLGEKPGMLARACGVDDAYMFQRPSCFARFLRSSRTGGVPSHRPGPSPSCAA